MEFAHSKGKARKDGQTSVRMADVGGIGPVVGELQEVIEVRGKGRKDGGRKEGKGQRRWQKGRRRGRAKRRHAPSPGFWLAVPSAARPSI